MGRPLISDELWRLIEPLLPKRPPPTRGGRPPVRDRDVLTGILFVLKTGIPWEALPDEMGCGSCMTCLRRLRDWQQAGVWRQIRAVLERGWPDSRRIDWSRAQDPAEPPRPDLQQASN